MGKHIILIVMAIITLLAIVGCGKEDYNAFTVSPKWKSAPIITAATGQNVGQAYQGFAVGIKEVRDEKAYFSFAMSDPSAPSMTKIVEFYIPLSYMRKSLEPLVKLPEIISLDMIRINQMGSINKLKENKPICVARFNDEVGPIRFINKTDNGYQFTLGMNVVYVAEQDVKLIKYID